MGERRAKFPADAFTGTAGDYAEFRPPYPRALLHQLCSDVNALGSGTLVDLACGPGRICLDLADSFGQVIAIDLESEMIETGRTTATCRGIGNIDWRIGLAEELDLEAESVDLVVIGDAFHRLDQDRILDLSSLWLRPDGHMAILGSYSVFKGSEPWQAAGVEVVNRWTGGSQTTARTKPDNVTQMLAAGFVNVIEREVEEPIAWTLDSIVGFLRSASQTSRRALGDSFDRFEEDLRSELLALSPEGEFQGSLSAGYRLGRSQG